MKPRDLRASPSDKQAITSALRKRLARAKQEEFLVRMKTRKFSPDQILADAETHPL